MIKQDPTAPDYKMFGEDDRRRFYKNRQLALNRANDACEYWPDKVQHVLAQFTPDRGFLAVIVTDGPLPEAQRLGFEIQDAKLGFVPSTAPADWADPKKKVAAPVVTADGKVAPKVAGSKRPGRGKTLQAWNLFDTMVDSSRAERIAAGVALGINKSTVSTQHSRWAKENEAS